MRQALERERCELSRIGTLPKKQNREGCAYFGSLRKGVCPVTAEMGYLASFSELAETKEYSSQERKSHMGCCSVLGTGVG